MQSLNGYTAVSPAQMVAPFAERNPRVIAIDVVVGGLLLAYLLARLRIAVTGRSPGALGVVAYLVGLYLLLGALAVRWKLTRADDAS